MAGYSRPLSRNELRQIRRQKQRIFFWSAAAVCFVLTALVGLLYLMHNTRP